MGTSSRTLAAPTLTALGTIVLGAAALVSGTFGGLTRPGSGTEPDGSGGGSGDRGDGRPSPGPEQAPTDPPGPGVPATEGSPWVLSLLLLLVATALAVVVVALVVAASLRIVRRRPLARPARPRAGTTPARDEEPDPDEPESVAAALHDGLAAVADGPPRNAIVATWLRLEEAVTGERLPHHPADTPAEFVERALSAYGLDEGAIRRLAVLYEEARFSLHPLTEAHRHEARDCLERLLARLPEVGR